MTHRRDFLLGAGAGGLTLFVAPLRAAAEGHAGAQVLGVHRRSVGDIVVTALLDGYLEIDANTLTGATADEVGRLLAAAHLPIAPVPTGINAYLIETGGRRLLVDGGAGGAFGPTAGRLLDALASIDVGPESIDTVFATHLHPDHVGALVDADGGPVFANAEFLHHPAEAFWLDDANFVGADDTIQFFVSLARGAVGAYGDAARPVGDGDPVAPGVEVVHLPGHTPGHSGLMIASGDETMLLAADLVHVGVVQFAHPDWTIGFDVDQPQAAETRARAFDMAASDRLEIAGSHIVFPSFGRLERAGSGYDFRPSRWDFDG